MRRAALGVALLVLVAAGDGAAWTLTGKAPRFARGAVWCEPDSTRPVVVDSVKVRRYGQQSATWVAKRDSMLAFPAVFARYWPKVKAEADPVFVAAVRCSSGGTFAVSIADTTRRLVYVATARTTAGVEGVYCGAPVRAP